MELTKKIRIKRIEKDLPMPEYKTSGAVAFDIYSRIDYSLASKEAKIIPSNLIIGIPEGYMLMIASRSGNPKRGFNLANGVGIIDQDFNGPGDELGIFLYNFSEVPFEIKRGDRIAQGIFVPIVKAEWEEVDEVGSETRGSFGSTGIK